MASVGFRWLDILEKEFDNAFVDLDVAVGELESEEPDVVYSVRQKLCTLSSCFAQLTHKAQTIFQNSTKIEAELIHMRAELVESKSKRGILEKELHNLLLQLHTSQLTHLPGLTGNRIQNPQFEPDVDNIKKKIAEEIRNSPSHTNNKEVEELKMNTNSIELSKLRIENSQLESENSSLRNSILALNSEVYGAKLAAKYLDKELAGRIQQLQLLGREMRGDVRDKLWRQLESEILLQRHKTVVRACRRNGHRGTHHELVCEKPEVPSATDENTQHFGDVRSVVVKRKPGQGLGISITGGREHGVPILISELEQNGPTALSGQLFIGDAILTVNDKDLRQVCHREAVDILQQQTGDCRFQVQYIAADDSDNSLEEDGLHFKIFDSDVCNPNDCITLHPLHASGVMNTPTAPRTPESANDSRTNSRNRNLNIYAPETTESTHIYALANNNIELITFGETTRDKEMNIVHKTDNETSFCELNRNAIDKINAKKSTMNRNKHEEENLNCSMNSLVSENFSSPMQTSTDVFLDSEILSTDVASNESPSPKSTQQLVDVGKEGLLEVKRFNEFCLNATDSHEIHSPSADSCDSSPTHYPKKSSSKKMKNKNKHFGVKTLQSIFTRRDGYSDISSNASDLGDELQDSNAQVQQQQQTECVAQFEDNIHSFLSETFAKDFTGSPSRNATVTVSGSLGSKKCFKLNGQNLRIGKALRLCPNDEQSDNEQKKEKLLARYVYNANLLTMDGIGDPDFGTPV